VVHLPTLFSGPPPPALYTPSLHDALPIFHAPREGSDAYTAECARVCTEFLSTLPARGATGSHLHHRSAAQWISIHAPREGSDGCILRHVRGKRGFLSTLPARGATTAFMLNIYGRSAFLSTLPARGATDWEENQRR